MDVRFPGGLRVDVEYHGFTIRTDQPVKAGGDGTAPSPFDLFLASIGACAGFYALNFCKARNIRTDGLCIRLDIVYDAEGKMVSRVDINVSLPGDFPPQYRDALLRAVESCTVKKHIQKPPEFAVKVI